ncbi:MAG TPA: hypothetical protein VJN29_05560, partial [Intrasporangium sp.]|nr:hypothetical protein [Intrasporangium sp.]
MAAEVSLGATDSSVAVCVGSDVVGSGSDVTVGSEVDGSESAPLVLPWEPVVVGAGSGSEVVVGSGSDVVGSGSDVVGSGSG